MRSQLAKAKQQVATAIADEKRLRDQADAEFKQGADWEAEGDARDQGKPRRSRQAGADAPGRAQRRTVSSSSRRGSSTALETEKLKNSLRDLNDKIEEAKRKKNLLVARQRRAQAQKRIAETMSSLSEKSAFEAFARMEERIETNERQLKASIEIEEEFTGDRLAQDFKQLERGAAPVASTCSCSRSSRRWVCSPPARREAKALGAGAATTKRRSTPRSRSNEREEEPLKLTRRGRRLGTNGASFGSRRF